MNELPAALVLDLFIIVNVIVARKVKVNCAQQNHGDHGGEEEGNHEGVDDAEPLDFLEFRVCLQERVPARGPLDGGLSKLDIVGESDGGVGCASVEAQRLRLRADRARREVGGGTCGEGVRDRHRHGLKADDSKDISGYVRIEGAGREGWFVDVDSETQMVVHAVALLIRRPVANRVAQLKDLIAELVLAAHDYREVVEIETHEILIVNALFQLLGFLLTQTVFAKHLALFRDLHEELVRRRLSALAHEDLAKGEVARRVATFAAAAEGERVIIVGDVVLNGGELIRLDSERRARLEVCRRNARKVEGIADGTG